MPAQVIILARKFLLVTIWISNGFPQFGQLYIEGAGLRVVLFEYTTMSKPLLFLMGCSIFCVRKVDWGPLEATTTRRKTVVMSNAIHSGIDTLEFPERVIHLALAYKHLVVVTTTQCYVHNINNINTPVIIDLREGSVSMVLLAEKLVKMEVQLSNQ